MWFLGVLQGGTPKRSRHERRQQPPESAESRSVERAGYGYAGKAELPQWSAGSGSGSTEHSVQAGPGWPGPEWRAESEGPAGSTGPAGPTGPGSVQAGSAGWPAGSGPIQAGSARWPAGPGSEQAGSARWPAGSGSVQAGSAQWPAGFDE